eukprot:537315_1
MAAEQLHQRHFSKTRDIINGYFHRCSKLLPSYNNIYIIPWTINDICLKYYHIPWAFIESDLNITGKVIFQYRPVRVWRWDPFQYKWRVRGKGKLTVCHIDTLDADKITFMDEKHEKIRLLQYIDDKQYAKVYSKEEHDTLHASNTSAYIYDFIEHCIVWNGEDYTMDEPLYGKWRIQFFGFTDNVYHANYFLKMFNQSINNFNKQTFSMLKIKVPSKYKCFICFAVGIHWMVHCVGGDKLSTNKHINLSEEHIDDTEH